MQIRSKRAKTQKVLVSPGVSYKTEVETYIVTNTGVPVVTPEDLKAIEEVFERIRRQLQSVNLQQTVYDGDFW